MRASTDAFVTSVRSSQNAGSGPSSHSSARMAAPVGVTASPGGPPWRTGRPTSSSSTAGGGTGMGPWSVWTRPRPSSGGAERTRTLQHAGHYVVPRPPTLAPPQGVEQLVARAVREAEIPAVPDVPPPKRA